MKKIIPLLLFVIFFIGPKVLYAQKTFTATEAADSAQSWRGNARDFWTKKGATPGDIAHGVQIIEQTLQFLDSVPIRQLGEGSFYLRFRKSDILRDLVTAYVINHQYKEAIETLDKQFNEGTSFGISMMVNDSAFSEIKTNPQFIAVLDKYKNRQELWNGDAFKTPYKNDLPTAEKVAGLSLLWTQARANFVYFDRLTTDWNQTYLDFIPQVTATTNTLDYYRLLQKFYAQLHDGHSNVYMPRELSLLSNSRPPVKTELIAGKVLITLVKSDSLRLAGLVPGLEVLKIDGIPVKEYADLRVKPYQSSSTPQDLEQREFNYALLAGDAAKPVQLTLKDRSGNITNRSLYRTGYQRVNPLPAMTYKEIGQIGYLAINNFEDNKIIKQFDSLYSRINITKGLVIDIRENGGGDSGIGNQILARLTDKKFDLFAFKNVQLNPRFAEPLWSNGGIATQGPDGKLFYNKPVVLLVSANTFSAAEDFAVAFDAMKRGTIIGQPTGGSTGQPVNFSLPGGGSARVCGKRETYPNGKEFVGIGVQPTIIIYKTVADVYTGTDAALNKALATLNQ